MKKARKPNGQFSNQEPAWNPTPEEIAAECLEIQKGWTEYDFARRAGKRVLPHLMQARRCPEVMHYRLHIAEPDIVTQAFDPG